MNEAKHPYYLYPVWDPLLRVLHWWNVLTLSFQIISGSIILILGSELNEITKAVLINMHFLNGYMFAGGLFTRLIWLFIGSPTALWKDLLPLTLAQRKIFIGTIRYYISGFKGSPPLYKAHNPFAGVIYIMFFAAAGMMVITGTIMLNLPEDVRREFPLIILHRYGYYFIIFYVISHISAVFIHELVERHNIISSMVHGKKTFTEEEWRIFDDSNTTSQRGG